MASSFFAVFKCISYTNKVNIITLSGRQPKNEPLIDKGSFAFQIYRLYSFLYTLDMKDFLRGIDKERMHKKAAFYTYACTEKSSPYVKNVLLYVCTCIL